MYGVHNIGTPGSISSTSISFERNSKVTILQDTIVAIAASCFALIAASGLEYSAPMLAVTLTLVPVAAAVIWVWRRFSGNFHNRRNHGHFHTTSQPSWNWNMWPPRRVVPVPTYVPSVLHPLPVVGNNPPPYVPPQHQQPTGLLGIVRPGTSNREPVHPYASTPMPVNAYPGAGNGHPQALHPLPMVRNNNPSPSGWGLLARIFPGNGTNQPRLTRENHIPPSCTPTSQAPAVGLLARIGPGNASSPVVAPMPVHPVHSRREVVHPVTSTIPIPQHPRVNGNAPASRGPLLFGLGQNS